MASDIFSSRRRLWQGFIAGLTGIFFMAVGQGAFLILVVAYLEYRQVAVAEIGSAMAFLSIIEGISCLAVGHFYRGRHIRVFIIIATLVMSASAWLFSAQPVGLLVWAAIFINGLGIGAMTVLQYVATLERRPQPLHLGLAVGLYTAGIAAGNGLGAMFSGMLTDAYGFGVSFQFSALSIIVVALVALALGKETGQPLSYPAEEEKAPAGSATGGKPVGNGKGWVWILSLFSAISMGGVIAVFSTLFPIYALRAGLPFALVGTLSGLKMILAAVIRPFSGAILARVDVFKLTNWSLSSLAATTIALPFVGMGAGLTGLIAVMGLMFGTCRVTTATLVLHGQDDPRLTSRRISYYNSSLTFGQIIGPWLSGLLAAWLGLTTAIVILPAGFLVVYLLALLLVPRLYHLPAVIAASRKERDGTCQS